MLGLLFSALALASGTGCVGLAANLLHAIYGHEVKPEFEGLKKERIAILCMNEKGVLKDEVTMGIEATMRMVITNKLKKATVISKEELASWLSDAPENGELAKHVGRGVSADIVIMVDVQNLKLMDGQTMYRGTSDIDIDVYNVKENKYVFTKSFPAFTYPETAAISTTEMELARFQRLYVMMVGERAARLFVPSQMGADVATDARILEFQ